MRLAAALLATLAATQAAAIELKTVTEMDSLIGQVFMSPRVEAEALVADSTMLGKLGDIDAKLREKLPFGTDVVLFFAGNGDLLTWSDKSAVIELGYWEVLSGGAFNEVCIRFGHFGLDSVCISPDTADNDWLKQRTSGNPFGLKAGEPVPAALGSGPFDLNSIAATLP